MLNLEINKEKLSIKYILGNYKILSSFPTETDIIYSIVNMSINSTEVTKYSFLKKSNYEFRSNWLANQLAIEETKLLKFLDSLVARKYLKKVKHTNLTSYYQLIKNPFN